LVQARLVKAIGVAELDGVWNVERAGGLLPPLPGMRKSIHGPRGETRVGPLRVPFDVVGTELHYRGAFRGFVDSLRPTTVGWDGRALYRGREYGRFRLLPVKEAPTSATG
jgi:hypothetical protein